MVSLSQFRLKLASISLPKDTNSINFELGALRGASGTYLLDDRLDYPITYTELKSIEIVEEEESEILPVGVSSEEMGKGIGLSLIHI